MKKVPSELKFFIQIPQGNNTVPSRGYSEHEPGDNHCVIKTAKENIPLVEFADLVEELEVESSCGGKKYFPDDPHRNGDTGVIVDRDTPSTGEDCSTVHVIHRIMNSA